MRYYLKATGSTCYDSSGVTFPVVAAVDFEDILTSAGATNLEWINQFGWSNQPAVLCFSLDNPSKTFLDMIQLVIDSYHVGIVVAIIWD